MARKKGGHGGGGGHGWFVTFADLMGLLMSFFVMLTAYSTQDQKQLQIMAGSMRDAFGVQRESRFAGIVEVDGIPTRPRLLHTEIAPPSEGTDHTGPSEAGGTRQDARPLAKGSRAANDPGLTLAAASLRQALGELPEVAELSKNVTLRRTDEGLALEILDQEGRSMFAPGQVLPNERARVLLERLAPALVKLPNAIEITGHVSAPAPGEAARPGQAAELSVRRALAVRGLLAASGVPDARFRAVAGRGDADPAVPDAPSLAPNRRVQLLLLPAAPAYPPDPLGLGR